MCSQLHNHQVQQNCHQRKHVNLLMIIRGWQNSQKLVEYQRSWSHSHGKRLVKILIKDIKILPHPFVYNHPYRHQNLHHWFIIPKTPIITREPWEETFATSTWSEKISTRNWHQYLFSTRSVPISSDNFWFNLDVKIANKLHQEIFTSNWHQ